MIVIDNHLALRAPTYADINALISIKSNQKSAEYLLGYSQSISKDGIKHWIDYHNNNNHERVFLIEYNSEPIGHIGLYKIDFNSHNAEIGILIGNPLHHGKGLGKQSVKALVNYAFNVLALHRITAFIREDNLPSIKMFTSCGFNQEGLLVDKAYKNNCYYNVAVLSIINR